MKISDPQPPANDPAVNSNDDTDLTSATADGDSPSPFSQLLAKKREASPEGVEAKGGKLIPGQPEAGSPFLVPAQKTFEPPVAAAVTDIKHVVALPAELQQLIREISVVVNAAGNHQVHIEMNSKVLKGLHIDIERREGVMTIQFQSTSQEVTNLLSSNQAELIQGLADRGMTNAEIRVSGPRESSAAQASEDKRVFGRNPSWQSGNQGGKK